MARSSPLVLDTTLVTPAGTEITVGSPAWFAWLDEAHSFAYRGAAGRFTARKERHGAGWRWKAYQRRDGTLHSAYLGHSPDLSADHLQATAAALAGRGVAPTPAPGDPAPRGATPPPAGQAVAPGGAIPDVPLLATKLYLPKGRPGLVGRPRLTARLNEGLTGAITLISAPTGFGKTTLLSEWLAQVSDGAGRVAWLSLDAADSDPLQLLRYLVAAGRTLAPRFGEGVLALVQNPAPQGLPATALTTLMTLLVNDLTALPEGSILILDDYHLLQGQAVHEAMGFLFDHLPPQVHMVIATREDPPLPLARMRARRQINELRAADLRFTPEEAATFLNAMMGLDLSAENVRALESRTEGWIAGLQLAALSIRGRSDVGGFIAAFTGSHHFVLDYLAEEVFNRQSAAVQHFLLRTCLLPRLCGPLCDAVTGGAESQAMLQQVERANLFLVPLDAERRWYRYHHLFAELLQVRLQETHPDLGRELYRRASRWFAQEGLVVEAIEQALAGEDFAQVQHLIEQHAEPLWTQGQLANLLRWMGALPPAMRHANPQLLAIQAWTCFLLNQTSLAEIDGLLNEATAALEHPPAPVESVGANSVAPQAPLRGRIAVIRSALASMRGDIAQTVALCEEAFAALPPTSTYWRSIAALNLGFAHAIGGDMGAAARMLAQAVELCQAAGNTYAALVGMTNLAKVYWSQGQLQRAADGFRQALALLAQQGSWLRPYSVTIHVGLALVLYEWNDLDGAATQVKQGLEHAELPQQAPALLEAYLVLARIQQAHGDTSGAQAAMARCVAAVPATGLPWTQRLVAAYMAQMDLRAGDLDKASRWLNEVPSGADVGEFRNVQLAERERITRARVLLAQGRPALALPLLEEQAQSAAQVENTRLLLETLVLQALAWQVQDDTARALEILDRALALAAPEGYIRRFLDEGPSMAALLRRMPRHGGTTAYISRLLAAFEAAPPTGLPTPPVVPGGAATLVEPLNEREREVLHLLATGLSNRQIAGQLVVALSTVKWYINNLYSKLGVSSRTQALARAREWDLL